MCHRPHGVKQWRWDSLNIWCDSFFYLDIWSSLRCLITQSGLRKVFHLEQSFFTYVSVGAGHATKSVIPPFIRWRWQRNHGRTSNALTTSYLSAGRHWVSLSHIYSVMTYTVYSEFINKSVLWPHWIVIRTPEGFVLTQWVWTDVRADKFINGCSVFRCILCHSCYQSVLPLHWVLMTVLGGFRKAFICAHRTYQLLFLLPFSTSWNFVEMSFMSLNSNTCSMHQSYTFPR